MSVIERITASLADIRARSQKLVRLNAELLKAELKKKAQEYGGAIGMLVAGALLGFYALGFALATITVALALVLPLWLSLLIVTLALFLIIAILVLAARGKLRKLQSAAPGRAAAEAKMTQATVKAGATKAARSLRPARPPAPGASEPDVSSSDAPPDEAGS
jgi:Flp pilus assembly protein TadB